jgi:hypothetical protein
MFFIFLGLAIGIIGQNLGCSSKTEELNKYKQGDPRYLFSALSEKGFQPQSGGKWISIGMNKKEVFKILSEANYTQDSRDSNDWTYNQFFFGNRIYLSTFNNNISSIHIIQDCLKDNQKKLISDLQAMHTSHTIEKSWGGVTLSVIVNKFTEEVN